MPSESQVSALAAGDHCRRPPWWKRLSEWRITVLGQTGAAAQQNLMPEGTDMQSAQSALPVPSLRARQPIDPPKHQRDP